MYSVITDVYVSSTFSARKRERIMRADREP